MAISIGPNGITANGSDVLTYDPATGQVEIFHNGTAVLQTLSNGVQASNVTASLNGNGNTAARLQNARNITLAGDVTGSVSFDGSQNVSISTSFAGTITNATNATNATSATNATNATNINVAADNSTNSTHYITFTGGRTGNQRPNSDTGLTYNPNTNTLTTTIFSGTATRANYADLAEKYTTDEEYTIGTIMGVGGLEETTSCNGHIPIGVISENPAYLMNANGDGQAIALKGRVPIKVVGKVTKGDCVYSGIDGVGWTEGTYLVGIALENNDEAGEKLVECILKM